MDMYIAIQILISGLVSGFILFQTAFVAPTAFADVATVSTADITLSGEQTLAGVTTNASRVLVSGQADASENGIYVSAAGAWARAEDADASGDFLWHVVPQA